METLLRWVVSAVETFRTKRGETAIEYRQNLRQDLFVWNQFSVRLSKHFVIECRTVNRILGIRFVGSF